MDKDKSIMEVKLSRPYRTYGYIHAGYLLDSLYAGKSWESFKVSNLLSQLPETRLN